MNNSWSQYFDAAETVNERRCVEHAGKHGINVEAALNAECRKMVCFDECPLWETGPAKADIPLEDRRYILWNNNNGLPILDDDGKIIGEGVFGRMSDQNVYIKTYADYPDERRPRDLAVNELIGGVAFELSKQKALYDIYRVR